jgi:hypothetical protein
MMILDATMFALFLALFVLSLALLIPDDYKYKALVLVIASLIAAYLALRGFGVRLAY